MILVNELKSEFLASLLDDKEVSEIIFIEPEQIVFEKWGLLKKETLCIDATSYRLLIDQILSEAQIHTSHEYPFADGKWRDFRLSAVHETICGQFPSLNLRRNSEHGWALDELIKSCWCSNQEATFIKDLISRRQNLLIVGSTGSGKTTVLSSFLNEVSENERIIILEEVPELKLPNQVSTRLITRDEKSGTLKEIHLGQLVKRALRLRPDRLVLGEIRGGEAKDMLLALATGHSGSMASMHAENTQQALIRLEMLIAMGAPQWSQEAIRKLMALTIHFVIVVEKKPEGLRILKEIARISSIEKFGFTIETVFQN